MDTGGWRWFRSSEASIGIVAVATPVVTILYLAMAYHWTSGFRLIIHAPHAVPLFVAVLAGTGFLAATCWHHDLYGPAAIAAMILGAWPWLFGGDFGGGLGLGYALLIFAITALAAPANIAIQEPRSGARYLRSDDGVLTASTGLIYAGVALALQALSRTTGWMRHTLVGNPAGPLLLLAVLLGAALVAGLATWLWLEHDLRLPTVVAWLWLAWGALLFIDQGPMGLGAFNGLQAVALTPYPDTLFKWPWPLLGVLYSAAAEWTVRLQFWEGTAT